MSDEAPTIVWFRQDLRLQDNAALAAAVDAGATVIPLFIWAPDEAGDWAPGAASRWWLHKSLQDLERSWKQLGGRLLLRRGDSLAVLRDVVEKSGAARVFWNRRYEPALREVDAQVKRALREQGVDVRSFNSTLLNEPHGVATGAGRPYQVFTPYWRNVRQRPVAPPVAVDTGRLRLPSRFPRTEALEKLRLLPRIQWYRSFYPHWEVGEAAAKERLDVFLDDAVRYYAEERERPDRDGTSALSPYLHWGQIGSRQVVHALRRRRDLRHNGPAHFLREIYWREFAHHVLYHFPHTPSSPLRPEYRDFPWQPDNRAIRAWQQGRTGFPIVDAGMRQLWETGWMHNRVRMIVSSLLVKHLLQDWLQGARWFWDTLLDADLANNTLGWQWSGGCGADAAPYFRVFNPVLQGRQFYPNGADVKRWLPELSSVPGRYIHSPWEWLDFSPSRTGIPGTYR